MASAAGASSPAAGAEEAKAREPRPAEIPRAISEGLPDGAVDAGRMAALVRLLAAIADDDPGAVSEALAQDGATALESAAVGTAGGFWTLAGTAIDDGILAERRLSVRTGDTLLHIAARHEKVQACSALLAAGASLVAKNGQGLSAPQVRLQRHQDAQVARLRQRHKAELDRVRGLGAEEQEAMLREGACAASGSASDRGSLVAAAPSDAAA